MHGSSDWFSQVMAAMIPHCQCSPALRGSFTTVLCFIQGGHRDECLPAWHELFSPKDLRRSEVTHLVTSSCQELFSFWSLKTELGYKINIYRLLKARTGRSMKVREGDLG